MQKPARQVAQIISLKLVGISTKSLKLHLKSSWKYPFDSCPHRIMVESL